MIEDRRVFAVTLARGGSKGIPRKNMAVVGGLSLIQRALAAARASKYIDMHFVSTDDALIETHVAQNFGSFVHRPEHLATDVSTSADALMHALDAIAVDYGMPDIVVELMCTAPFMFCDDIDACIEKLLHTGADSVVSVARVLDHHPSRLKYICDDMLLPFFPEVPESSRQALTPHAFVRAGGIYAFKRDVLTTLGRRCGPITRPHVVDDVRAVNIDEPIDLELARAIAKVRKL